MDFGKLADQETITRTVEALKANGINAEFVNTSEEAKKRVFEIIPEGAEVMTMTSVTLDTIGIPEQLNESGEYDSVRSKLNSMDRATEGREMRKIGAAPDWVIGSAHAVTEDGHVFIASNTGSQLSAYVYGAGHIVWVIGSQKIVKDDEAAKNRLYEYVLPLESDRADKAYNKTGGSFISKLLIVDREINPERINLIFVGEELGF